MNGVHSMSEIVPQAVDEQEPAAVTEPVAPKSAGTMLREAREAAGLHIAALAVSMKVPVKKLEALEADRLDLLLDAVFVRALASSVCRTLKIDPKPVLERLPNTALPYLTADKLGINTPFRSPSDGRGDSAFDQLSKPVVLAALALLIAALVLIFFPSSERTEVVSEVSADRVATTAPAAEPALAALPAASGQFVDPAGRPAVVPALVVAAPAKPAPPAAATPAVVSAPVAAQAPIPVASTSTGLVVFKLRGASWVEVTDASGVVQLRRIISSGETVGASGALPLTVVVGRADATEVQVRGKPFDLAAVSKENVARFEVK